MSERQAWIDAIYNAYPRHVGSRAAKKAIDKALERLEASMGMTLPVVGEYLNSKTTAYRRATASWPAKDRKFIPHPSTWFNQDRFDDDPQEWHRDSDRPSVHNERGDRRAGSF